jgi:hypothetical protein
LNKHRTTREDASLVLKFIQSRNDKFDWLVSILRFWASGNLCRLGSPQQHLYLTYLAFHLMSSIDKDSITFELQGFL